MVESIISHLHFRKIKLSVESCGEQITVKNDMPDGFDLDSLSKQESIPNA
jgi:hypothetical protein